MSNKICRDKTIFCHDRANDKAFLRQNPDLVATELATNSVVTNLDFFAIELATNYVATKPDFIVTELKTKRWAFFFFKPRKLLFWTVFKPTSP